MTTLGVDFFTLVLAPVVPTAVDGDVDGVFPADGIGAGAGVTHGLEEL